MRIAHIHPRRIFPGGTERFVLESNYELNRLGVHSEIYASDVSLRPDYLSDTAIATRLAHRAIKTGCDTLVFHKGQEAAAIFRGVKAVPFFHEPKYDDLNGKGIAGEIYKSILLRFASRCRQILCNSEYTASRIKDCIPNAKLRVVYPGTRASSPQGSQEEGYCYYHSRFAPRKNQELLLSVFEELPYRLQLSGGTWDTKFANYQRGLMDRASSMPNVSIQTNIGEEPHGSRLAKSSVFLFPAKAEAFGLALLQAMAYGKPIIALDSGANAEVLGNAGILCRPDVSQWRRATVQVLSDQDLRRLLSAKSIARANEFSWEKTAKELIRIFETWE